MNQNRGMNPNPNLRHADVEEDDGILSVDEGYIDKPPHRWDRPHVVEENNMRWEIGMRTEIPKFHDTIKLEEFLDWLAIVEEILEFKGVPENK